MPAIVDTTRPACILIVDDNADNRELLEIILGSEGFVTISANGGEQALEAVELRHPDMILLDLMMPGLDGYQVAERLKCDPETSGIPIVMITGLDDRATTLRALSAGAEAVLVKPIARVDLVLRVRGVLGLPEKAVRVPTQPSLPYPGGHKLTRTRRQARRRPISKK